MKRRTFLAASHFRFIRIGCQANAWPLKPGDFNQLLSVVATIKSLGYVGFECKVRFVSGQFGKAEIARRQLQDTGMTFIGAHTSMKEAGHGYQGGGNPAAFMLREAPRIVGCHIKTFRDNTKQMPLGQARLQPQSRRLARLAG